MPGKGKPFTPDDTRINKVGAPKKRKLRDILDGLGAVTIKDANGIELDRYAGEERLLKEIVDVGIREKNPAMMKFIYQHMNTPQADPELNKIKLASEKARAAKLEIANAKARGELISRDYVKRVFGKIYSVHRSIFISGAPTLSTKISAITNIKDDVIKIKINEEIDAHCYKTLQAIKREINDFLTEVGGEVIKE